MTDIYNYEWAADKENGIQFVRLADKTEIVISNGSYIEEGLTVRLPKRKFLWIFLKQVFRGDSKLGFTFSPQELRAVLDGVEQAASEGELK